MAQHWYPYGTTWEPVRVSVSDRKTWTKEGECYDSGLSSESDEQTVEVEMHCLGVVSRPALADGTIYAFYLANRKSSGEMAWQIERSECDERSGHGTLFESKCAASKKFREVLETRYRRFFDRLDLANCWKNGTMS
jgi:hypothetical protein